VLVVAGDIVEIGGGVSGLKAVKKTALMVVHLLT
jgi:hypothetical protein